MHYLSNRYRTRRNSIVRGSNFSQRHNQRFFDPSLLVSQSVARSEQSIENIAKKEEHLPVHAFSDFAISDQLKRNIAGRGYTVPTPVQDQAIPEILAGRDVVGVANTGTGKTAAFLIPLIDKAFLDRAQRILIITPTRELAVQIRNELIGFSTGLNIDSVLCIGGVSIGPQAQRLRRNPQFVIGTPGRLKDLGGSVLRFANFNNIVLDEVDRMLDIGFVREIKQIIFSLSPNRLSLFFSATLPVGVQEVMRTFLHNPVTISVKIADTTTSVKQNVVKLNGKPKIEALHELLIKKEEFSKVLVFGRTKFGMEKLARDLDQRGFKVAAIHGNKNQNQRQRALNDFKNNQVQVLLATDIASRGLDIDDVTHVINYDLPESYEAYIHRIGRTGRADKTGVALTFI